MWLEAMKYKKTISAIALSSAAILFANYLALHRHVANVISSNPANEGIDVIARYQWLVNPSVVVYDLRGVSGDKSAADTTRVLFKFAEKIKDHEYKKVVLSYRGSEKFYLDGEYFKMLGNELATQNPIYLIRTLPENLYKPDGSKPFGSWTGGWLGVVSKQMEDFNSVHRQWYIDEAIK